MKDESKRDDAIAKLVSEKLRARAAAPGAACPEAEILAAYVERTLEPTERSRWEDHFAACARCQESIAQLVRLGESDEPVAARALRPASARKFLGLRWAWAAPMLLVLLVAGLWYTGEFRQTLKPGSETVVQSPAPPAPAAQKGEEAPKAAKGKEASAAQVQRAQPEAAKNVRREKASGQAPVPRAPASANAPAREAPASSGEAVAAGGEISRPREEIARAAGPTPAQPEARMQSAPPAAADQMARQSQGGMAAIQKRAERPAMQRNEVGVAAEETAAKARPMTVLSEGLGRGQAGGGFHYASVAPAGEGKLAKKSSAGLWRVGMRGLIQKEDSNGNWVTQTSGVTTDLLGAAFPSSEAGWVVGQAGTILRTTDSGKTWEEISSPTNEDLISVAATSADSAQISTRSGQTYSTSDGGKTWHAAAQAQ